MAIIMVKRRKRKKFRCYYFENSKIKNNIPRKKTSMAVGFAALFDSITLGLEIFESSEDTDDMI